MEPRLEGVLLAAGESSRMGFPKPLLQIGGRTFVEHIAEMILAVVPRLVIVVGAHRDRVCAAIPHDSRIVIVENPNYIRGQLSSLKVGLRATAPNVSAVLIHLADHPTVRAATIRAIVDCYERTHNRIVIARNDGHRGHPVIFDSSVFE